MGDATPLTLPDSLPYPITVVRVRVEAGASVRRGDVLLEYKFLSATKRKQLETEQRQGKQLTPQQWDGDMVGSWESSISGTVLKWEADIQPGRKIERRQATKPIIEIEQPCSHPVQIHGMCGVCGADVTNDDYMSAPADEAGPSRQGGYQMTHDASGVTVTTNEAKRLESISQKELLTTRRLSLIVDLDQTIIHTTVDPTVGEWLRECKEDAEEEKKAAASENKATDGETSGDTAADDGKMDVDGAPKEPQPESTTPPGSPKRKREKNPNAEALKDVGKFQLADDVPPGVSRRHQPEPVRWYYTKPRPGLNQFLEDMSKLYEMHVYTMGTRSYADAICKIVDPEGKYFGGRIISRDESGSMSAKSLVRLFPHDQSMVVIIDDRSDVWGDSPNLVKVVPYDFFVGIGDINGGFLPPTKPAVTAMANALTPTSSAESSPSPKTPSEIPSTEEGHDQQTKLFQDIIENRPLAKLEEEQGFEPDDETANGDEKKKKEKGDEPEAEKQSADDEEKKEDGAAASTPADGAEKPQEEGAKEEGAREERAKEDGAPSPKSEEKAVSKHEEHPHRHRKQFLNVNDHELKRVEEILTEIHTDYYDAYDSRSPGSTTMPLQCDVPLLIGEIKDQVLSGCVIVFTGVIAINQKPQDSEIWQQAEAFGAQCQVELDERVTHCVIGSIGTEKMRRAARMPHVQVVWLAWLQTSIAFWKREPEDPFRPQLPRMERPDTPPKPEDKVPDAMQIDPEDIEKDAEDFTAAWDDAAQAELDELINGDDDDDWSSSEGEEDEKKNDRKRAASRSPSPHRWSRENTPSRSILSRGPSPGPPKHVRYADDENQPLEDVREPQPGDIPSYPPKKKQKVLMLDAPSDDDDIPEANRMVYKPRPGDGLTDVHEDGGGKADGSLADGSDGPDATSSDTETDEFARMLQAELEADGDEDGTEEES